MKSETIVMSDEFQSMLKLPKEIETLNVGVFIKNAELWKALMYSATAKVTITIEDSTEAWVKTYLHEANQ